MTGTPPETPGIPGQAARLRRLPAVAAALLAAGLPFILGKYCELNSPDPFDSSSYVYSAWHVLSGARPGVEEIPSAQTGTLLVNLLGVSLGGVSETGPKIIQGLFQLAALICMFSALRRLYGGFAAAASVALAALYLSAPVIARDGNVKEQYMIALMTAGISCVCLHQLSGRRWLALLAGGCLAWAPLFKPTGISALAAVLLFLAGRAIFRHRTWRQTGADSAWLLAGAFLSLMPVFIWITGWTIQLPLPYAWLGTVAGWCWPGGSPAAAGDYITSARPLVPWANQAAVVFRYSRILMLPLSLAACSLALCLVRMKARGRTNETSGGSPADWLAWLAIGWWLLDLALVWVSPRPYEQYYLPLAASATFAGAYALARFAEAVRAGRPRREARAAATLAAGIMAFVPVYPLFAGFSVSPATGRPYESKQRGFRQKIEEIRLRQQTGKLDPWEQAGDFIRQHSKPGDSIYVWGWMPGIHLRARRFSAAGSACTSEMHVYPPPVLSRLADELLSAFRRRPPRFIVDTRRYHFPYDPPRPPLELWPSTPAGFLPPEPAAVTGYEAEYTRWLQQLGWPGEAERFAALKPLRDFVMARYRITKIFGSHVVFENTGPGGTGEVRP